jgi:regulator of protease activity HflC (stomatin/prohibitin superfamily)
MEVILGLLSTAFVIMVVLLVLFSSAIKIVKEYERGVVFRLGRLYGVKQPGLRFVIPIVDHMVKVSMREAVLDIPAQEIITKDNVTVKVDAVAYFKVEDPIRALVAVEDYRRATFQISKTSLRSVLGQSSLDELLTHREEINKRLREIVDEQTEPWGIKVTIVELSDLELPDSMKRAMARQAEAEREKRAKIIHAEGELAASEQLQKAATVMAREPSAIQLRYLQTLTEIAVEKNSTIIFPVPLEFFKAFMGVLETKTEAGK